MSSEQLQAFVNAVKSDPGLQDRLKAASQAKAAEVEAIAQKAGFAISKEEILTHKIKPSLEMSDMEIEACISNSCGGSMACIWNSCGGSME
jgi:predicted ribosomally synthesized peptide with nif11-like leader